MNFRTHSVLLAITSFLFFSTTLFAQQPSSLITAHINTTNFHPGDSLYFDVKVNQTNVIPKVATLHLKIVELSSNKSWDYRYPLINGSLAAALKVDSGLREGAYAMNFIVQKDFFHLIGKVNSTIPKRSKKILVNYLLILKNKQSIADVTQLNDDNQFRISNLLFSDTASVIFSVPGIQPGNLNISLQCPLDSLYEPIATVTSFIAITPNTQINAIPIMADTLNYQFHFQAEKSNLLEEVIVEAKAKKRLEDFKKENVSALYSSFDDIEINGIDDEELSRAPDLLDYLTTKSPGLRVATDAENGSRYMTWRKKRALIFIDEVKLDEESLFGIHPADIALIKLVRPGTSVGMSSGDGGAILIYLKSGDYLSTSVNRKYKFSVIGYRALDSDWK